MLPKGYSLFIAVISASGSDTGQVHWEVSTQSLQEKPPHALRCTGRTPNHALLSSLSLVRINSNASFHKAVVSCRKVPELRANIQVQPLAHSWQGTGLCLL